MIAVVCLFFIADSCDWGTSYIGSRCLVTHLKQVKSPRLHVTVIHASLARHNRALTALDRCHFASFLVLEGLGSLESRASMERIEVFVVNKMGSDQAMTELASTLGSVLLHQLAGLFLCDHEG